MMKRLIINADDCGISKHVNAEIEKSIVAGKITSTTIMANMDDFEGAKRLYGLYNDRISFGWHVNLDEGKPLTQSQILLDKGFFVEKDGGVFLNGSAFRKELFDKLTRDAIKKELRTQWSKLRDSGIDISHADSHHYIHTQPSMIQIIPSLFKELGVKRCRHIANYGKMGVDGIARRLWERYFNAKGFIMPNTFCSFADYYCNSYLRQGEIIELMVHPGHSNYKFDQEYRTMLETNYDEKWPNAVLINYKDI